MALYWLTSKTIFLLIAIRALCGMCLSMVMHAYNVCVWWNLHKWPQSSQICTHWTHMLNQGFQWLMPIISGKKRVSGFIDNLIITEGKSVREAECTCGHILNHHKIMKLNDWPDQHICQKILLWAYGKDASRKHLHLFTNKSCITLKCSYAHRHLFLYYSANFQLTTIVLVFSSS